MIDSELLRYAERYAERRSLQLDRTMRLGYGNDGAVWLSRSQTAIKALRRRDNYGVELECYQRFRVANVTNLCGFAIPQLIGFDDELMVIEMTTVTPPYILDFAKAHLDRRPEFPEESLVDWRNELEELFEGRTREVRRLISALERFGIYYYDAKPGNITFAD